jgi:hypothetical protein
MKGCFWNGDGFGHNAKHMFVREIIREHRLDFFAILETGRSSFSAPFLNHLAGGLDFCWYCLPPQGRSRGILVGINSATLSISKVSNGDFSVKFHVRSKNNGFDWVLVPVYGVAQDEKKAEFLSELVRTCDNEQLPMLIGGDFNILRRKEEKNNDNFNARWPFMFNTIIESSYDFLAYPAGVLPYISGLLHLASSLLEVEKLWPHRLSLC